MIYTKAYDIVSCKRFIVFQNSIERWCFITKRKLIKKFCFAFIILILPFSLLSVNLFADNELTDLEQYYKSLESNFGENLYGSCTNIATGMLLSYYDTYLNDNIIAEEFDVSSTNVNSPGTLWEDLDYYTTLSSYKTALLSMKDVSLQARFYSYSCDLGNTSLALSYQNRKDVLENYFSDYCDWTLGDEYSFYDMSYAYYTDTQIMNFVKN